MLCKKSLEKGNTPIGLSLPFEALQFRVRKINWLFPQKHKIMELLVLMLVGAIYKLYGLGQYLRTPFLLMPKNIIAFIKKIVFF